MIAGFGDKLLVSGTRRCASGATSAPAEKKNDTSRKAINMLPQGPHACQVRNWESFLELSEVVPGS